MKDASYTVRADRFAVLGNTMQCHGCGKATRVSALLVVDAEERYEVDDPWEATQGPGVLRYVEDLDAASREKWQGAAPWIHFAATKTSQMTYFLNACEHCGAAQGDWYLAEPDGPFFPTRPEDIEMITVAWQDGPLRAVASVDQSSWMDELVAERDAPPHG